MVLTMVGAKTGAVRKVPLMRVEHDGRYLAVASMGGAPKNPVWYYNLIARTRISTCRTDRPGSGRGPGSCRLARNATPGGHRAVAAYPDYADYQTRTTTADPGVRSRPGRRSSMTVTADRIESVVGAVPKGLFIGGRLDRHRRRR